MNNNYNSNTVVKQDFAVVKQVDGRAAHMTTQLGMDHAKSIPEFRPCVYNKTVIPLTLVEYER